MLGICIASLTGRSASICVVATIPGVIIARERHAFGEVGCVYARAVEALR